MSRPDRKEYNEYNEVSMSCPENYNSTNRIMENYMWSRWRFLTKDEMESIKKKDILDGIGSRSNWTYNCSLRHLLNKKYGQIDRSSVVKLETLGFAITIHNYDKEREEFMEKDRKKRAIEREKRIELEKERW